MLCIILYNILDLIFIILGLFLQIINVGRKCLYQHSISYKPIITDLLSFVGNSGCTNLNNSKTTHSNFDFYMSNRTLTNFR